MCSVRFSLSLFSISSPMLLIALGVFAGAFYIIHLKTLEKKFVIFGKKISYFNNCTLYGLYHF